MKLRSYLALMVTAILVPVSLFSALALNMLLHSEREAALRTVREAARATALAVDRELGNAETALRLLATSGNIAQENWEEFYRQAKVVAPPGGAWVVLSDANGQQILNTLRPFGSSLPKMAYTDRLQKDMAEGRMHVSNLRFGSVANQFSIVVALPATAGGKTHIVSQVFAAGYFDRAFTQRNLPSSWIVGISDREGITIARSHNATQLTGKPVRAEILKTASTAEEATIRNFSRDGVDTYTVITHSALSGWIIAMGVPVQEIESAARRAVIVAGIGLLAALCFAAALATFFGRRLAHSMAGAVRSAAALGRGELPATAKSGVAEVDTLHTALAEAGAVLLRERESRTLAESERARLLISEQEARKVAEVQNRAKDEFLAMLGHELRNPLNAITAAISVMEARGIGADKIERARLILRRQTSHLGRIIDDLLDLSRVMSGKIFLARQRLDLAEAVRDNLNTLAATGTPQNHAVSITTAPTWIDADPTRIEQIISNLLVNAFKYTPEGGRIEIDVRAADGEAVFSVRDSGVGMSAELIAAVFDVFVQGPAQLDRALGGLGIGLSLVRRLVMLHGGTVGAESSGPGQGSTFTVRLPLAAPPSGDEVKPEAKVNAPRRKLRVLLIEDNEDSRHTMSALLTAHGHQVGEAGDGMEGLCLALIDRPDVAVVDIGLPGLNGYEVARRLRAESHGRIRLIALTGYGRSEDRQRALDAGFDMHLVKPVLPQQLIDEIARLTA
jgi:signal transduction histidine kinase